MENRFPSIPLIGRALGVGHVCVSEGTPVEAQAMVSACLETHCITAEKSWYKEARRAFEWFLGRNDLHLPVYDPTTGGCRDGLHSDRPNENQGAESTLAFLQSLLELRLTETIDAPNEHIYDENPSLGSISAPHARPSSDSRKLVVSGQ